jgi:hypothetical protein
MGIPGTFSHGPGIRGRLSVILTAGAPLRICRGRRFKAPILKYDGVRSDQDDWSFCETFVGLPPTWDDVRYRLVVAYTVVFGSKLGSVMSTAPSVRKPGSSDL